MNRKITAGLGLASMLLLNTVLVYAEEPGAEQVAASKITTQDGLLSITLPNAAWQQVTSGENTEMFSDGDCAIVIDVYKNGDTLPAVSTADDDHALVYTAAASTKDYVLYVVGYANAQSDFAGICDAINTISVDNTKITQEMLNHAVDVSEYNILEMNYTAWVSCDGLNVRSTSEQTGEIITSLVRGDKVTVTGSVTRNGAEIGWARIKTPDGTEGYVSSQFLNTTQVNAASSGTSASSSGNNSSANVTRTGNTRTVYGASGKSYTLYEGSDGKWRAESGTVYEPLTDYDWGNANGDVLYNYKPEGTNSYRTGNSITLYHGTGVPVIAYEYADGSYIDDDGVAYSAYGDGQYIGNYTGEILYTYDPSVNYIDSSSDDETVTVRSEEGDVAYLTLSGSDVWVDQNNISFWRYNSSGTWVNEYGFYYYEY